MNDIKERYVVSGCVEHIEGGEVLVAVVPDEDATFWEFITLATKGFMLTSLILLLRKMPLHL